MRSKTVVLSLVLLLILSATAFAQQRGRAVMPAGAGNPAGTQPGPGDPDGMGPLGPIGRCLAAIGLTDAQKADIKALLEAEAPTLQALHETMKTDEEAVKTAVEATTPDPCAVGTAVLKVHADREAIQAELETLRTKLEALLTAEQKLKLAGCLSVFNPPRP